jgi:hypothetical protein
LKPTSVSIRNTRLFRSSFFRLLRFPAPKPTLRPRAAERADKDQNYVPDAYFRHAASIQTIF